MGSYRSARSEIFAYLRERFPLRTFAPLAVVLAAAARGAPLRPPRGIAAASAIALSLLLQFRLKDDLADRAVDAARTPERVLVRSERVFAFATLVVALASVNALLLGARSLAAAAIFLAATATFSLFYRDAIRTRVPPLVRYHVVLSKYPMFVLLLADHRVKALPMALLVYFTMCAYEVHHDAAARRIRGAVAAATAELALACLLVVAVGWTCSGATLPWEAEARP